jgi:hypothetical protein
MGVKTMGSKEVGMASLAERMIGATKLDVGTYEEVEADTSATGQAMSVVVLSAVAAGIGSIGYGGFKGMIVITIAALVGWVIWAGLTYLIGTKMLPEPDTRADVGELLRTTGFAQSPGLLGVLGIIPVLGGLLTLVVSIWLLVAVVMAVRQALDYKSTGRAVGVCLIGFIVRLVVMSGIKMVAGVGAAAVGAIAS